MKETIYTIPVNEAFDKDCECPICELERALESKTIDFILGQSLMQPEHRTETNKKGFCKDHLTLLYNSRKNTLGLSLMLDTYLEQKKEILKKSSKSIPAKGKGVKSSLEKIANEIDKLQSTCYMCEKMNDTMDKYIDVITYLWTTEKDFKTKFNGGKGFCLPHYKLLLEGASKYLKATDASMFATQLIQMENVNLERIQEEIHWFTKKFDYANEDKPWGNSKDATPRTIEKLVSRSDITE